MSSSLLFIRAEPLASDLMVDIENIAKNIINIRYKTRGTILGRSSFFAPASVSFSQIPKKHHKWTIIGQLQIFFLSDIFVIMKMIENTVRFKEKI